CCPRAMTGRRMRRASLRHPAGTGSEKVPRPPPPLYDKRGPPHAGAGPRFVFGPHARWVFTGCEGKPTGSAADEGPAAGPDRGGMRSDWGLRLLRFAASGAETGERGEINI